MPSQPLHAPWRMDYIRTLTKDDGECFLCKACECSSDTDKKDRLLLWISTHCVVGINKFPYTNGHLLVAPKRHIADLEDLSMDEALDLQVQTIQAVKLLKKVISPQGFNIGINLGRCAGAGLPGHLHQHIVPRWGGDTNFMSVIGEVRVVPQAMAQLWEELIRGVGQGAGGEGRKDGQ